MSAKPFRWQIHKWLETFGPLADEQVRASTHVGPVCGAGAWGVTVELGNRSGRKSAVTLLRPSAREQAELEFDAFDRALELLQTRFPHFDTTMIRQLVREARRMSLLETDMAVSKMQSKLAAQNTDGFQVEVHGQRYSFSTAQWLDHGTNYKETAIVTGTHFNDLPAQQKPAVAKAILTKELYLRLTGRATDHDRHGAQQRIQVGAQETTIGEFDFGGMALTLPTSVEKELLAHVVRTALRESRGFLGTGIGAKPFGNILSKVIQDLSKSPYRSNVLVDNSSGPLVITQEDVGRILGTFQRDVLALCDYVSALGSTEKQRGAALAEIVRAIMRTNEVDPVIASTLKGDLGWLERFGVRVWMRSSRGSQLKIYPPQP